MRTHFDDGISWSWRGVLVSVGALLCQAPQAQAATNWIPTATQGINLTNFTISATPLGPLAGTTPLRIVVGLRLQNQAQLNSAILAINTPGNPSYRQFLKPSQFTAAYSPSAAQVKEVESYLSKSGLTNISAPANRQYIVASGSAAAIEAAFNTTLWQYQISGPNGEPPRTVYANTQAAQVPNDLSGIVLSVIGLQTIDTMHTFIGNWPTGAPLPPVPPPTTPANPATFTPQDFWNVYDVGAIAPASNTTIAIFAEGNLAGIVPTPANPSAPNDLRQFESENQLPQVPVTVVQVGLGSTDTSGAIEFDMDTQESTGMAGAVKQLIVYDADSMNDIDLIPGFNDFVTQDLAQAGGITPDLRRDGPFVFHFELEMLLRGADAHEGSDVAENLTRTAFNLIYAQLPGIDLGKVEDIINNRQQMFSVATDRINMIEAVGRALV